MAVDKLLPVSNMASSRSEENVNLKHFQHILVSQCWWVLWFYGLMVFCFWLWQMLWPFILAFLMFLADVIAICHFVATCVLFVGWCYCHVASCFFDRWWCCYHQADVVAFVGRCYCHCFVVVGITTLIDFTKRCAIKLFYGMFFGRCYCHVADVIATIYVLFCWQML